MKRRTGVVGVVAIAIAVIAVARLGGDRTQPPSGPGDAADRRAPGVTGAGASRSDPRTPARASISGKVTDEAKGPIARAQVCTNAVGPAQPSAVTRALTCAFTDEGGRYKIGDLVPADYLVHASARQFRPGAFHPSPGAENHEFPLAAGQVKTGVDVELKRGGAELTGVVHDISGGPIAHVEVREATRGSDHAGAAVETDEQGRFSLWIDRGDVTIDALGDGYVPAHERTRAPGKLEIFLTPESSLAGTVVDATTGQPVAGAEVAVETTRYVQDPGVRTTSDAQGAFRLEHLAPGRYDIAARTERGYGRSPGSLLVGLGQHAGGAVIPLHPAHHVAGKVVIANTRKDCPAPWVVLEERLQDRRIQLRNQPDGQLVADGVLPGSYAVTVHCNGYAPRERYEPIVVGEGDVSVVWEVDEGARIRGKVLGKAGAPVDGARLRAQSIGGARDQAAWSYARSKADGTFELRGLRPGTHRITLTSDRGVAPEDGFELTVAPGATLERDFVLEDSGALIGTVVDDDGSPASGAEILIQSGAAASSDHLKSGSNGSFALDMLRPGEYRVSTYRDMSRIESRSRVVTAAVTAGQTTTIQLTVEPQRGAITGVVVDAANQPVPDAFLSWAREGGLSGMPWSDVERTRHEWRFSRPVLTEIDGTFRIAELSDGLHTLRAYRKGGGEAIAEHVAIGGTARLQIKPTASIAGTARRGGGPPPVELKVTVAGAATGFRRIESFYRTGGQFTVTDLPAGHFDIIVDGSGSQRELTIDLREGEVRTGLAVELAPLVTLTGRLVEPGTQKPVPGFYIAAVPTRGAGKSDTVIIDDGADNITDDAGRFTVRGVAAGEIEVRGSSRNLESRDHSRVQIVRRIPENGPTKVDLGDILLIRSRTRPGEPMGVIGLRFNGLSPGGSIEPREINWIDPAGPAAGTGLVVGDVIMTCDGIDLTEQSATALWTLINAPPGTRLTLGTRRGVTATIVLARGGPIMQ